MARIFYFCSILDIIDHLLRNGANVNDGGSVGEAPLIMAIRAGHVGVVSQLVSAGAVYLPEPSSSRGGGFGRKKGISVSFVVWAYIISTLDVTNHVIILQCIKYPQDKE